MDLSTVKGFARPRRTLASAVVAHVGVAVGFKGFDESPLIAFGWVAQGGSSSAGIRRESSADPPDRAAAQAAAQASDAYGARCRISYSPS